MSVSQTTANAGEPGTAPGGGTLRVLVRYFAGAKAAAGTSSERVELDAPADLATLVALFADQHGPAMARVLTASSFLLDEVAGGRDWALSDGAQVDVLPPFAGG